MKSRIWLQLAIAAATVGGLLGLFVGVMNVFTTWCGEDCGSTASRVTWGFIQVVAALLLLGGAYLAVKGRPDARWVWIAAIVASIFAFFWAWLLLLLVVVFVGIGVYVLWPSRRDPIL